MKIRALKKFEGIRDKERNVYPKEGDVWEVSEERAEFLKSHGVVEYVTELVIDDVNRHTIGELKEDVFEKYEEEIAKEEAQEKSKATFKKKESKKKKASKK